MRRLKDRGLNPNDGSRRSLKSKEHKTIKDYKRIRPQDIRKYFLEEWSIEQFINEEE